MGMYSFVRFAIRTGLFAESRFMRKVLDEWIGDVQEFVRMKLPRLILLAIFALILARLLRLITNKMIRIAARRAPGTVRVSQVKTLAGVVRTTLLTILCVIVRLHRLAATSTNLASL